MLPPPRSAVNCFTTSTPNTPVLNFQTRSYVRYGHGTVPAVECLARMVVGLMCASQRGEHRSRAIRGLDRVLGSLLAVREREGVLPARTIWRRRLVPEQSIRRLGHLPAPQPHRWTPIRRLRVQQQVMGVREVLVMQGVPKRRAAASGMPTEPGYRPTTLHKHSTEKRDPRFRKSVQKLCEESKPRKGRRGKSVA